MRFILALCLSLLPSLALAVQPGEMLADPKLEARARDISAELRCLVCQNQSIDDSHAPLARDLRLLVRDRLTAGASDDDIRRFLVERYGDFILLKPRFSYDTLALWISPFVILILGAAFVFRATRQRRASANADMPLTTEEQAKLAALLSKHEPKA